MKNFIKQGFFKAFGIIAIVAMIVIGLTGCPTEPDPDPDPALTGSVIIPSFIKVDQAAAADTTLLAGTGAISYQWETSATQTGTFTAVDANGTSASYTPVTADETKWLRVTVTRAGYTGSISSTAVEVQAASAVAPPTPPTGTLTSVTLTPATVSVAKGSTQVFTLSFVYPSSWTPGAINWSVDAPKAAGTSITSGGSFSPQANNHGTQTQTLTVDAGETNATLTVRATYGSQSWTATVTVVAPPPTSWSVGTTAELDTVLAGLGTNAIANTEYTITLTADINSVSGGYWLGTKGSSASSTTTVTIPAQNVTITLKGDTTERTLQLTGTGSLFTVGGTFKSGTPNNTQHSITLKLDNNITLKGVASNTAPLVFVQLGGKLEIKAGAKITGNTNTNSEGGGISVNSLGTVTMLGGEISGNTVTSSTSLAMGGGVAVDGQNAVFTMSGGKISGNTASNTAFAFGGGVFVSGNGSPGSKFTMTAGEISGNTVSSDATNNAYGAGAFIFVFTGQTPSLDYVDFQKTGGTIYGNSGSDRNKVMENSAEVTTGHGNTAAYVTLGGGLNLVESKDTTSEAAHTLKVTKTGASAATTVGW
ncbi:hypothetical protein FACS189485_07560 [Spirochaetia bacterium]|nr:hypothetical protein FACS189485_07560 [Spirochaetia bacterium]